MKYNPIERFVLTSMAKAISRGETIDFDKIPSGIIKLLREQMEENADAYQKLVQMHPNSEWKQMEEFLLYNFGNKVLKEKNKPL